MCTAHFLPVEIFYILTIVFIHICYASFGRLLIVGANLENVTTPELASSHSCDYYNSFFRRPFLPNTRLLRARL
jgi:hypothetical protein